MWNLSEILSTALTALVSLAVLFLLTKLLGNKQISQLSMFDYIIGISIGSIAAEMATELENPVLPLVAMAVYGIMAYLISWLTRKSVGMQKLLTGKTILLMDNGVLFRDNLRRARFDLSDFLTLCRVQGYFDLGQIQTAILEQNGTVSILPKSVSRPVTPEDFSLFPKAARIMPNVVMDGHALHDNLKRAGYDENWLVSRLQKLGYSSYRQVYLATCDAEGNLTAYPMEPDGRPWDPFE